MSLVGGCRVMRLIDVIRTVDSRSRATRRLAPARTFRPSRCIRGVSSPEFVSVPLGAASARPCLAKIVGGAGPPRTRPLLRARPDRERNPCIMTDYSPSPRCSPCSGYSRYSRTICLMFFSPSATARSTDHSSIRMRCITCARVALASISPQNGVAP